MQEIKATEADLERVTAKIETQTQAIFSDVDAGATSVAAAAKEAHAALNTEAAQVTPRIERLGGRGRKREEGEATSGGKGGVIEEMHAIATAEETLIRDRMIESNAALKTAGEDWETNPEVVGIKKAKFVLMADDCWQKIENGAQKAGSSVDGFVVYLKMLIAKMDEEVKEKEEEEKVAQEVVDSFITSLALETERAKVDQEKYAILNRKLESLYQNLLAEEGDDEEDDLCRMVMFDKVRPMRILSKSDSDSWDPPETTCPCPQEVGNSVSPNQLSPAEVIKSQVDTKIEELRQKMAEAERKRHLAFENVRQHLEAELSRAEKRHLATLIDQVESVCSQSWASVVSVNRELGVFQDALHSFQAGVQEKVEGNLKNKSGLATQVERRVDNMELGRKEFSAAVAQFEDKSQIEAKEIGDQTEMAKRRLMRVQEEAEINRRNWEGELMLLRETVEEISRMVMEDTDTEDTEDTDTEDTDTEDTNKPSA